MTTDPILHALIDLCEAVSKTELSAHPAYLAALKVLRDNVASIST